MSERRSPEIQAILDAIERGGPYASVEDVNRELSARTSAYNARPQAELGGLSPDEMAQLLYADWKSQGALRLNENLTKDDLVGAAILADARTLLEYVANEGPVKETAARNLPRAVVASLLPRLRMLAQRRMAEDIGAAGVVNEGDVLWLPILRHILMFAGLVASIPRCSHRLHVRHVGHEPYSAFVTVGDGDSVSAVVRLQQLAVALPTVAITGTGDEVLLFELS